MKTAVKIYTNPQSEAQHQTNVFRWSAANRGKYPELRLLYHVKNETKEGARQVAIDRESGVKKGVPDLCLPVARHGFHGLYIELKTPSGSATQEQRWWIDQLRAQGYCCEICYGWQAAVTLLEGYLNGKE